MPNPNKEFRKKAGSKGFRCRNCSLIMFPPKVGGVYVSNMPVCSDCPKCGIADPWVQLITPETIGGNTNE